MRAAYLYSVICCCFSLLGYGQERSGVILNRQGEAVDFATVVLLQDGEQKAAAITDTLGRFSLSAVEGIYRMKVQNIAYQPIEQEVSLTSDNIELGSFCMEEAHYDLDAVVVTASPITREADRFVMQVGDHIPSLMNKDGAEVLQQAPGVWVDDKGISINGASGSKVFINDRELKLTPDELAAYLRNYRSSDIARVEVIPQAGAEYSADSKGGVIRIILRKQLENGLTGNAMMQTMQGRYYGNYRPSATVNALVGKWSLHGSITGLITSKSEGEMMDERFLPGENTPFFRSESYMKGKPSRGMGRFGSIYEINKRHSLGAEVEYGSGRANRPSHSVTTGDIGGMQIHTNSDNRQKDSNRYLSATFNYIHKIDTIGSVMKLIADYSNRKVTGENHFHSRHETEQATMDSIYRNHSSSNYRIFTTDLMMQKELRKDMRLTAGAKYSRNRIENEAYYEGQYQAQWRPLEDYNYALDYVENIGALYATFAFKLGRLSLLGGLRGEYTHTTGKGTYDKRYCDLFPNLNLTYSFNSMQTFLLVGQYARNIERPNFWHLNSNRIQYSDYSYSVGNPLLRPTYINRFSLTVVYHYRYTLTVGGNMHRDLIREVTKSDPMNPEVKYVIPENHYSENHYFVAISCPLPVTKWLSTNANLVGVKQDIRGEKRDKSKSHYLYFINATATVTLPAALYLELTYSGTSRLYSANSGVEPRHLVHFQVKKQLFDKRLNVTLGLHNLFDSRGAYFADMPDYASTSRMLEAWNARAVKLSLQYNFKTGKTFRKRTVEGGANNERGRMERSSEMK
ncbi:TonB-dependent receptor family protein [Parabacteroides sp. OttesenSCG-928-N08]|nr:TonB-dependent receptor family protein [Parabacteroides sp. OttesenSCG-928-N08]